MNRSSVPGAHSPVATHTHGHPGPRAEGAHQGRGWGFAAPCTQRCPWDSAPAQSELAQGVLWPPHTSSPRQNVPSPARSGKSHPGTTCMGSNQIQPISFLSFSGSDLCAAHFTSPVCAEVVLPPCSALGEQNPPPPSPENPQNTQHPSHTM